MTLDEEASIVTDPTIANDVSRFFLSNWSLIDRFNDPQDNVEKCRDLFSSYRIRKQIINPKEHMGRQTSVHYFIYGSHSKIVGGISAFHYTHSQGNQVLIAPIIVTNPRNGVGSSLLDHLEDYFSEVASFIARVHPNNNASIGFFEKNGYKRSGNTRNGRIEYYKATNL